jgi:hypothetical protein
MVTTTPNPPERLYTIQIQLNNITSWRKNRILQITTSNGWLSSVMSDACGDPLDIMMGNSTNYTPNVSDVSCKIKIQKDLIPKLVVRWSSIPVDIDNLALVIGGRLAGVCLKNKIDLAAFEKVSPA